jgi:hypothetical protein
VSIYDEPAPYLTPRRRRMKRVVRAVSVATAVVVIGAASVVVVKVGAAAALGQCTPAWLTGADPQLCINAEISGRTLIVSGTTSLTDGAIVQVWAEDFGTGYDQHWITSTLNVTVSGGGFGQTFDLSSWGAGTVTVNGLFEIGPQQPADVAARYGPNGERLGGPDLKFDLNAGDPPPRAVQVSTNVDLSAG